MRLLLLLSLLPGMALANSSNSSAYADGSVVNYNTQSNNALGDDMPYAVFSRDRISCPTGKFTVAVLPSYSNTDYGDADTVSLMAGLSVPLDFNDTIDRCEQQQRLMIRATEIDQDMTVLSACKRAFDDGIYVDPDVFKWAEKCTGLSFNRPAEFYK